MKKKSTTLFLLSFLFISCTSSDTYKIKGKIASTTDKEYIMLYTYDGEDNLIKTDSSRITDNSFSFEGKENLNNLAFISFAEPKYFEDKNVIEVVLEHGKIKVLIDSVSDVSKRSGTPLNDLLQTYKDSTTFYDQKIIDSFDKGGKSTGGGISIQKGSESAKAYYEAGKYDFYFRKENINNVVGKTIFIKKLSGNMSDVVFGFDKKFNEIYDIAPEDVKSHPRVKKYFERLEKQRLEEERKKEFTGKRIQNFTFQTPDGKSKELDQYIGKSKYILIDFWASWCAPCIASIPLLKEIYAEYKPKGLEIIAISFDDDKDRWINALKDAKMPWSQLSDLQGDNSPIKKAYHLFSIPNSIIVDNKGNMISIYNSGSEIKSVLDKLFKNQ